jgi:hypothetical protein
MVLRGRDRLPDLSALTEHHRAVGHLHDVVQVVRHEDHGDALLRQPPDEPKHLGRLAQPEGGGRLVEDHEAAGEGHGARHGDGLALPTRHQAERLVEVGDADLQALELLAPALVHVALAHERDRPQPARAAPQLAADEEVRRGREVVEQFGGTYNGNAVAVEAAIATIEQLEDGRAHERVFVLGERMREGLREIANRAGVPAVVGGLGSLFVLCFMEGPLESYDDVLRNDNDLFVRYRRELIARGVFEMPESLGRSHISASHTEDDIDRSLAAAEEALAAALDASARPRSVC